MACRGFLFCCFTAASELLPGAAGLAGRPPGRAALASPQGHRGEPDFLVSDVAVEMVTHLED
eukprot:11571922-Heterocapsa_arctica.AAC.1